MPYLFNENARIYWHEEGSGPPVLLIMGLSFAHEMWYRVLPWLKSEYRSIVFDNRGVGLSDVPRGPYSIPQMTRDAVAVLDAAGVKAAHVVGASMGGMIAQELAIRYPDRVSSLVLGCTTYSGLFAKWPHFSRGPGWKNWSKRTRLEREQSLRHLLYADSTPISRIEEDITLRCGCSWCYEGFFYQLGAILAWNSYRRLPSIKAPTLVIHGEEDHMVPVENGRVLASRIPNARFCLVPQAGHILMTDQPEVCRHQLLDFLAEQTEGVVARTGTTGY